MGLLVDTLGNKAPGQLIKSANWNDLVAAVENVEETLTQKIDDLSSSVDDRFDEVAEKVSALASSVDARFESTDARIQTVEDSLDQLRVAFNALRNRVEPIINEYSRVTMESTKVNYAIGELAEITARATDIEGNPLDLRDQSSRPWIDFVTAWGQLKPVPGFISRGGAGNKTISVQVNQQGLASVHLKAEHTAGFTDDVELEVASALTTTLRETNRSIADSILQAATPLEASEVGAFRAMTIEYDRTDAVNVRSYMDTFYAQNSTVITGRLIPRPIHSWKDYRSTVLAFLKSDSDPRTPDQSRGVSSIQVSFRDWISPWVTLDYLPTIETRVAEIRKRLATKITPDYRQSVDLIIRDVKEIVFGRGLLGKQREYIAVRGALDGLEVAEPPSFLPTLMKTLQNAITVQQTQDYIQAATIGGAEDEAAFDVIVDAVVRGDTGARQFRDDIAGFTGEIARFDENIAGIQAAINTLDGRMEATLAEGGELQRMKSDLNTVYQQVGVLQNLDVSEVQSKMVEVQGLNNRLQAIELIMLAR